MDPQKEKIRELEKRISELHYLLLLALPHLPPEQEELAEKIRRGLMEYGEKWDGVYI